MTDNAPSNDARTPRHHPLARRARWVPDDVPPEGQRAALHRLAAAIRRMNHLLIETEAPEADLLRAAEAAEQFAACRAASGSGWTATRTRASATASWRPSM